MPLHQRTMSGSLYRLFVLLLLCLAAMPGWLGSTGHPQVETRHVTEIDQLILEAAPTGVRLRPSQNRPCAVEGVTPTGEVVWRLFDTRLLDRQPQGYAGPVPLLVGIDARGLVSSIRVLAHQETPSFVRGLNRPEFLGQFTGKGPEAPLRLQEDIDGLSRATITSEAVCAGVRLCLRAARTNDSPAEAARDGDEARGATSPGSSIQTRTWAGLLLAAAGVFFLPRRAPVAAALLVVVGLGYLASLYLSCAHLKLALLNPGALLGLPWPILIVGVWALGRCLLRPRGYCTALCPAGRLQDILVGVGRIFLPRRPSSPDGKAPIFAAGTFLLPAGLLLLVLDPWFALEKIEAFGALFLGPDGFFAWVLVAAFLIGSLLTPRFYCRCLCPLNPLFAEIERGRTMLATVFTSLDKSASWAAKAPDPDVSPGPEEVP
jgi:NosR/NirI family transcriptional regulator, nitrous oxide reductase regulator